MDPLRKTPYISRLQTCSPGRLFAVQWVGEATLPQRKKEKETRMKYSRIAALCGFATCSAALYSQVIGIGPFAGTYSEGWEGFVNYVDSPTFYEPEPILIMGGMAHVTTATANAAIYRPGYADFGLGNSGLAQVAAGAQGMGVDSPSTMLIAFHGGMSHFGGYWGCATFGGGNWMTFEFFDTGGGYIDTVRVFYDREATGDGLLEWHGWETANPLGIGFVLVHGDYVVNDELQAHLVPEPATMIALGAGLAALMARRRR